jgi:hypothetical protein
MRPSVFVLSSAVVLALASGCEQRAPMVYVLEGPQDVTLTASASESKVRPGESVVLRVERRTVGQWKQIPRDRLRPGQCWQYRPPPELEPEVADNVEWQTEPKNAVSFNTEFRMDHKRIATMRIQGTIKLIPISAVPCEPDRVVEGTPLEVEVS